MDDLISRSHLIESLEKDGLPVPAWLRDMIESEPCAEPEIIRCKDCKWWGRKDVFKDGSSIIVCKKGWSGDSDGFCHNAEMRDLIYRQDAINALEWKWAGKAAIDAIKTLPSAEPENHKMPRV